ncbi:MAG: hypothetical protein Q7J54_07605 [Candidatus Woesearchaeota archaeon]|nr:hypothetical protein [Candidatus Woesearchaeota archaeon]
MSEIESIIDYFKNELSLLSGNFEQLEQERKFNMSLIILVFSAIVVLSSSLFQSFLQLELILLYPGSIFIIKLILFLILFFIISFIFLNTYIPYKTNKFYFDMKIKLETILKCLFYFKAIKIDSKNVSLLTDRLKFDLWDNRPKNIFKRKDYQKYENLRLKEYLQVISKIKNKLVAEEKKIIEESLK